MVTERDWTSTSWYGWRSCAIDRAAIYGDEVLEWDLN